MKHLVILHNKIENNTPDELDVLEQRDLVGKACTSLGYKITNLTVGDDLKEDLLTVENLKPDMVFNLVEATWGKGELIYLVPAILNAQKIPYTGVPLDALFVTTNKVLAKKMMQQQGLPTAPFFAMDEMHLLDVQKKYIAKPIWEEASVGISEEFIFNPSETEKVKRIREMSISHYFIEEFIDGREFNVSMVAQEKTPEVLPPAEMVFSDFFDDKPKIVGYKAKWDLDSPEYKNTIRAFDTLENNPTLKKRMEDVCKHCWKAFNLHGYARVDFRVDLSGDIYILEINGNPCIAPDSGFIAAAAHAGYSPKDMIERIIKDFN